MATKSEQNSMRFTQWVLATVIAAIGMGLSILTVGAKVTYSRGEGEQLEKQVDKIEIQQRKDREKVYEAITEIQKSLGRIEGRLDQPRRRTRER